MSKHDEMVKESKTQSTSDPDVEVKPDRPDANPGSENKMSGKTQRMMSNTVSATKHVGSGIVDSVTTVATGLVHGVGDLGGEVVTVVRDTANTAIAGVGSVGETAVHTLAGVLAELVSGVKEVGSAAMRNRASSREAYPPELETEQARLQKNRSRETAREEALH